MEGGSFSAREIARRAKVNHGQVHHLFAGKNGLHRALLEFLAEALSERIHPHDGQSLPAAALAAVQEDPRFVHMLASYLIENPDGEIPQESFPVVTRLAATGAEANPSMGRPQLAMLLSAGLGWAFFQRWIRAALELDDEQAQRVETLIATSGEPP